jgi:TPR repeat protein
VATALLLPWPAQAAAELDRGVLARAQAGDAAAQNLLGDMYENGNGVERDPAQAAHWYRLAAEQGLADAQLNLGVLYENGEGVERSDVEAARW